MSDSPDRITFAGWAGLALMLFAVVHFVGQHGRQWEFGRYGMPRTLLAADGRHLLDGSPALPYEVWLIRNGIEEEVMLGAVTFIVVCLGFTVRAVRAANRSQQELERIYEQRAALDPSFRWPRSP